MTIILSLLAQVLHFGLMVAAAPTMAGALDWLDARLSGLSGPPVLLPWRDLARLRRKTPLAIEHVSVVSRLAPAVGLGAMLSAAALAPSFTLGMALSPLADVLVVVTLLTVARVAGALAALDSGAALPGLNEQRASALAVLAEPALMASMVALALMGGSFNLDLLIAQQRDGLLLPAAASIVAMAALLGLAFVDFITADPELGQAHSGVDLAMARMAGWLRRLIWIDLAGGLFAPFGMATTDSGPAGWLAGVASWGFRLGCFIVFLSVAKATLGRLSPHDLPDVIGVAALLAVLAMLMALAGAGAA